MNANLPVPPPAPLPATPANLRALATGWQIGVTSALAWAFFLVTLVAAGAFYLLLLGASDATQRLLLDRSRRIVQQQETLVRSVLQPVQAEVDLLGKLIETGRVDPSKPAEVVLALRELVESLPQVSGAGFGGLDAQLHLVLREENGLAFNTVPLDHFDRGMERLAEVQHAQQAYWGELLRGTSGAPLINRRVPLRRDGKFVGGLVVSVAIGGLSRELIEHDAADEAVSFILVGKARVLAHRALIQPDPNMFDREHPLPRLERVGSPVLEAIWSGKRIEADRFRNALGDLGHVVEVGGERWVFVYREMTGFGPDPWLIGRYFPLEDATRDLERLQNGFFAGLGVLGLALGLALFMGRRIGSSVAMLGEAAGAIERLEFQGPPLPRSRLKQIDEATRAFEKTREALRMFGLYVPQRLVRRLIAEGEEAAATKKRNVTVMFTDVVGFTSSAEGLSETETLSFLNEHLALLVDCVEDHEGVVDKFIGDAVMAVWGGLRKSARHADDACGAALAIAAAIREDNAKRRREGRKIVRVRVGVHSGPAVVGNIGPPGRLAYTVVGDTVNVANRLEQLGKEYMTDSDEVVVLVSGDTIAALEEPEALGVALSAPTRRAIRGRSEGEEIYRLA